MNLLNRQQEKSLVLENIRSLFSAKVTEYDGLYVRPHPFISSLRSTFFRETNIPTSAQHF
jgi:hypothetical protein